MAVDQDTLLMVLKLWRQCSSQRLSWESGSHCSYCGPLQRFLQSMPALASAPSAAIPAPAAAATRCDQSPRPECNREPGHRGAHGVLTETAQATATTPRQINTVAPPAVARCPTCDSPQPTLHPARAHEGEVSLCRDAWHASTPEGRRMLDRATATTPSAAPGLNIGDKCPCKGAYAETERWCMRCGNSGTVKYPATTPSGVPAGVADGLGEPFCACGRRWSQCDRSRSGCTPKTCRPAPAPAGDGGAR